MVNVGQTVSMTCNSVNETRLFFGDFKSEPISYSAFLTINPVHLKHAGNYYCFGYYNFMPKHFLAARRLIVYGEFSF